MRRVVVTGMGIASPLGVGVEHVWKRLINGESGISVIQSFDTTELTAKIAGQVPAGKSAEGGLDLSEWIAIKELKKMDRFIHLGIAAASMAIEDSGWIPQTEEEKYVSGVMIGSGIGGLQSIYEASVGRSLKPVESARAAQNPAMPSGLTAASAPPATITSASPKMISRAASPMACTPVAQAVTAEWFGPLRPYLMET